MENVSCWRFSQTTNISISTRSFARSLAYSNIHIFILLFINIRSLLFSGMYNLHFNRLFVVFVLLAPHPCEDKNKNYDCDKYCTYLDYPIRCGHFYNLFVYSTVAFSALWKSCIHCWWILAISLRMHEILFELESEFALPLVLEIISDKLRHCINIFGWVVFNLYILHPKIVNLT